MPTVEVPGIGDIHFPDDMPVPEMEGAVKQLLLKRKSGELDPAKASTGTIDPVKQAAQAAGEEASAFNKRMLGVAIPTAATAASFMVPGGPLVKTGAEMALGGLGEAASQLIGASPKSATQIGMATAAPLAGRAVLGVAKGAARGLASFFNPQQLKVAGSELLKETFKGPQSKALFSIAEKMGPIPSKTLLPAVDTAIDAEAKMSTPNKAAIALTTNLKKKMLMKQGLDYADLMDEVQRLRKHAETAIKKGNNVTGTALNETANKIINQMDDIHPAIKAANAAYRREQNIVKLADVSRKANPAQELRKLIDHDKLFSEGFSEKELAEMIDLTDRVGRVAGTALGLGRVTVQSASETVAEALANPAGRGFLKMLLKQPGFGAQSMAVLGQFMRGLSAYQQPEEQPSP